MRNRIVKVIAWRAVSISITMLIMWIFTGDVKEATGLTLFLHAVLAVANYIFETFWDNFYEDR